VARVTALQLVGVDATTGSKVLYTLVFLAGVVVVRWLARGLVAATMRGPERHTLRFWTRQAINLVTAVVVALGLLSIWFDNGLHAAAAVGILGAGVAFALQKAVTSVAGYFLILRGDIFTIGDRIVMGGVRGDVIGLGFLRTTILEMGQPAGDEDVATPVWVDARQHTGRIVTVTNGVVFDEPVYNYSREFPFLWEELGVSIPYDADRGTAEGLLLDAASRHSLDVSTIGVEAMQRMRRRFYVPATEFEPEVFVKMQTSWIELTVRFVVPVYGIRKIKSAMTRDILDAFDAAQIPIATTTLVVSDVPPIRLAREAAAPTPKPARKRAAAASDGARRSPSANGRGARSRRS
jgi:small-conductance mechanosensitive channel